MARTQSETLNQTVQAPDGYYDVRTDLEGVYAKLDSFESALGNIAEWAGERAGLFFSFGNLAGCIKDEAETLVKRMMALEPDWRSASLGEQGFFRRTYEEWSAALIVATEASDDCATELQAKADDLADALTSGNATTAGDAALKMRAILHSLSVADFPSHYPMPSAALSSLLADLERIDAAGRAGKAVQS
jgi:hypothetical protein